MFRARKWKKTRSTQLWSPLCSTNNDSNNLWITVITTQTCSDFSVLLKGQSRLDDTCVFNQTIITFSMPAPLVHPSSYYTERRGRWGEVGSNSSVIIKRKFTFVPQISVAHTISNTIPVTHFKETIRNSFAGTFNRTYLFYVVNFWSSSSLYFCTSVSWCTGAGV